MTAQTAGIPRSDVSGRLFAPDAESEDVEMPGKANETAGPSWDRPFVRSGWFVLRAYQRFPSHPRGRLPLRASHSPCGIGITLATN